MTALTQQDFYLNSNQYTDLKRGVRQNNEGAQKKAMQQFESLFITQMLKEMRAAAVVDDSQHSSYMDFYTDMYDQQLATIMASQGGIGIADQLEQQLNHRQTKPRDESLLGGKFFPLTPNVAAERAFALNSTATGFALSNTAQNGELKLPHNLAAIGRAQQNQAEGAKAFIPLETIAVKPVAFAEAFHQVQQNVDNSAVVLAAYDEQYQTTNALSDEKIQSHKGWANPQQFIQELMPQAQIVAQQLGVKPEVLVAQSALETGWGKHTIRHQDGSVSFSLFGIKADSRWAGDTVQVPTLEFRNGHMQKEMAQFRAYDSVGEALEDYVDFIKSNARYQQALSNSSDEVHYVTGLQKAGYATDPAYANKILNILNGETLKQGLASLATNQPKEVA